MNTIRVKKGDPVVKKQDKVIEWYLIQEGSVTRNYRMAEIILDANSIIGILESEWFSCDYIAREDTTLIVIPCNNAESLFSMLSAHENFRPIFLKTALEQRHKTLCLYAQLQKKCTLLHRSVEEFFQDYQSLCARFLSREREFVRIQNFATLTMAHKAENWEINNSNSLIGNYLKEYMQLMVKDGGMCVGAIMEASAQMRRVTQGISEMVTYLLVNREMLANDLDDDILHLFSSLAADQANNPENVACCRDKMQEILDAMGQLDIFDPMVMEESRTLRNSSSFGDSSDIRINLQTEDCVSAILSYADYDKQQIRTFKNNLAQWKSLPDLSSADDEARRLRKALSTDFYDIYEKAFFKSMITPERPSPILLMFFNFGFMDTELVGLQNANLLMKLVDSMELFHSEHIFTVYEWLCNIYWGKVEPSRNEFDMDFKAYLMDQRRLGEITAEEFEYYQNDLRMKVKFEISNMFRSGHRISYGRVTSFCPILTSGEMIQSLEKMALTAEKIETAMNVIRNIDYSIFYRELSFSDSERGINQEWIMREILPDVILMPTVGSKGMMWQETASVKNDTPARFLFPLFMTGNFEDQLMEVCGRYRWEICRKLHGVYWNDFREKSLTSEYCDYLQFYRKNKELSGDAKEKLQMTLQRCRNNYREVFVCDYLMWMKYESNGSFRLNKLTRGFLISYCPFSKSIREELSGNPLYQNAFRRLEIENEKKVSRLNALYAKYEAAGGEITPELKENLRFYQM